VTAEEAADFRAMIREMTVIEVDDPTLTTIEVEYSALIRVLGPVEVVDNNHSEVQFRKSKSLELLCWLSLHRDRPTVSAARTALWEVDVEDATFHNVLSELRRGLNSHGITDAAWRATKQRLALDPLIFTDAELFRRVLLAIDDDESELSTARALEELCGVLALVRGLPFAGEDYAWADAEGITSTFVWLVTRAVDTAAQLAKHRNDDAALLAAATAGLRMMPGDERFSQLRDDSVSAAAKNAFKAPAGNTQHGFANDRLAHL
jgi:two-component SAPR family response regulator